MLDLSDIQTSLLTSLRPMKDDGAPAPSLPLKGAALASALRGLARRGLVEREGKQWRLTDAGRDAAGDADIANAPRAGTKLARLAALISTGDGATIHDLIAALNWQAHTIRAALTRLRQRGLTIERRADEDGVSRYRALAPTA